MKKKINEIIDRLELYPICLPINKKELEHVIKVLFSRMFPVCDRKNRHKIAQELKTVYKILLDNISIIMNSIAAESIVNNFFNKIPLIQEALYKDAQAFYENDPAADSLEEVILAYPGFFALATYRIAHEFHKLEVPIIPRIFSEYAHAKVGIDIHPGAQIGESFFLDHGTGTVIGETTIIGNHVKIYQRVTLGALYVTKNLSKVKRHPTVENNVVIYAGATILGGDTIIGHDSIIGGNVWLTKSILPYTLVYYSSDMKIKTVKDFKEPINYVI